MTQRAEVIIDGNVGPLRQKLREGLQGLKQFGGDAERSLSGVSAPLKAVTDKFIAFTALLAGGALAGDAIRETVAFTKEVTSLSRLLGISTTQATAWNIALGDIYQDSEALSSAIGKLNRVLAEDEDKLNKAGIATRDANGHFRAQGDIFLDVMAYLAKFTAGVDRNVEGTKIFGKSWAEVAPLVKQSKEQIAAAAEKAEALGLTLTKESEGRVAQYRAAMNDVGDVMLGVKNAVAHALMPVLTKLGQWFADVGPAVVTGFKGAVGGLVATFWGLKNAVTIAWEVITSFIYTVTEPLRSLGSALLKLVQGDFKGATDEMMDWPSRIGKVWSESWKNIVASSSDARDKLFNLFSEGGTPTEKPEDGEGSRRGKKPTTKKPPSQMAYYEEQLALDQQFLTAAQQSREVLKAAELDYWRTILQQAQITAGDRLAISRKVAQLETEIRRTALDQQRQVDEENTRASERLAIARVDAQRAAAQALLSAGQITKRQEQQMELGYQTDIYQIQAAALRERLRLLELDPNTNPVEMARIKNELLQLEQEFQTKRLTALGSMAKDKGISEELDGIEEDARSGLSAILAGTQTWYQAMAGIFSNLRQHMISMLVTQPLKEMTQGWAKQLAIKLGFIGQEKAVEKAASATTVALKAEETTAAVAGDAAQAGAAAAKSQAGIPIVGPYLALAAMAAVFAAVSGLGKRKSAAGGFDIPRSINPLTQLHEEEMVLPKHLANPLRDMLARDGGQAAAAPQYAGPPVELKGVNAGDFFMLHRDDLARVLRTMQREFTFRA